MSGHSKWATIKRKKAKEDEKRGRIFSKLCKEITVAAKVAGPDPEFNAQLRLAIQNAKQANMPADKIQGAIDRATGGASGSSLEEMTYEGYGPVGVAVMVELLTDNKNRTSSEIRRIFSKGGGSLGEQGCVAWNFQKRGVITLQETFPTEDALLELALEVGGEDVLIDDGVSQIMTNPEDLAVVVDAIRAKGIAVETAELSMIPKSLAKVDGDNAKRVLRFLEDLEDQEDVRHVYANPDIPDDVAAR